MPAPTISTSKCSTLCEAEMVREGAVTFMRFNLCPKPISRCRKFSSGHSRDIQDNATRRAAALAVAAHGDADAGDGEAVADEYWRIWHAQRGGDFSFRRRIELQQGDVGGGAMRQHCIHLEGGMDGDAFDVLKRRRSRA